MKWFESVIIELCLRPCSKLGNSAFWERLLFGRRPLHMQNRFEAFLSTKKFDTDDNIEWIEIRTRDASCDSRNRARIAVLAVKAADSGGDKQGDHI